MMDVLVDTNGDPVIPRGYTVVTEGFSKKGDCFCDEKPRLKSSYPMWIPCDASVGESVEAFGNCILIRPNESR